MNNREMWVRMLEALRWPIAVIIIIAILREPITTAVHAVTGASLSEVTTVSRANPANRQ
jgi:hypothetical protein